MTIRKKSDFPVSQVRRYLEPGPVVLVSSVWKKETDIMTMGWHTVMEFSPSLIGCIIASSNHSFELIRQSAECVVNLPTVDLLDQVVGIGNCSGVDENKFDRFGLTPLPATRVKAPLIGECHASFECKVVDDALVDRYNFFILEVVKAHVAPSPKHPHTLHYAGEGTFMTSGKTVSRRARFKPEYL